MANIGSADWDIVTDAASATLEAVEDGKLTADIALGQVLSMVEAAASSVPELIEAAKAAKAKADASYA